MEHSTAQRRLVKSPPELWAEVSSEDALARRLAQFGEIRITRVDPETTVAWEGDRASGTVQLEPAGWGTKVTLTAVQQPEPTPPATPEPKPGFFARLFRHRPARVAATPDPSPPAPGPEPPPPDPDPAPTPARAAAANADAGGLHDARTTEILSEMLDDLGAAHHRPFSRD